jgi:molybdopterin-guanine dinucleotide biosynthesis protein A
VTDPREGSAPAGVRSAIIAGGAASRLGGAPKGLLSVGGRRILDRVVDAAGAAFGTPPVLVANAPEAPSWRPDLRVVTDLVPGAGTLGGLYTAIMAAPAPVVCLAWDMPFVTPDLLRRLADGLGRFDAVLPTSGGPRGVEPVCAGYGPACAGPIRAAIDRGDLRAIAFHRQVRVERLGPDVIAGLGDPARLFFNVNEPRDLDEAERLCR